MHSHVVPSVQSLLLHIPQKALVVCLLSALSQHQFQEKNIIRIEQTIFPPEARGMI